MSPLPVYVCPKCGREVEMPPGRYYCKECSGPFTKVWMEEVKPEEEQKPKPSPAVQRLIEQGLINHREGEYRLILDSEVEPDFQLIVDDKAKEFWFWIGDYWNVFGRQHYDVLKRIIETLQSQGYRFIPVERR